jgi:3-dehydroquinate dehydratase-2
MSGGVDVALWMPLIGWWGGVYSSGAVRCERPHALVASQNTEGSIMDILIVNGPNLRYLGVRQPEIYGIQGMDAVPALVASVMGEDAAKVQLQFFQSNSEGSLIDRLEQAWQDKVAGIVINPGAYTHTSLALADCLAWIGIPYVEVHLSNVAARDSIRHRSLTAPRAVGTLAGFGVLGYALAVRALWQALQP